MKKLSLMIIVVLMFSMTACAARYASETQNFAMEAPAAAPMERGMDMDFAMEESMEYEEAGAPSTVDLIPQQRMVIRNADLSIVVDVPGDAMKTISQMAERMGGFVVSSNMSKSTNYNGVETPEGYITVRVPAELLDQALEEIKALTKNLSQDVLYENISGQDVTKEYTDLSSRLRNYEETQAKLREFMDEAEDTEAALAVFEELAYYSEQIEIIKGQMKYYEESAALSAISIRIQAHEAVNPITVAGWQPSVTVSKALQSLVNAFQAIVDALIWIILFVLPILIILAVPVVIFIFIVRAVIRRARKKKQIKKEEKEA